MQERFPLRVMGDPPVDRNDGERFYAEKVHLLDYIKVLSKRRWTVVTVFLVFVLTGMAYAFIRPPIYEARVRLMIEVDNPNVVQFQQLVEERRLDDYYETQYQLLQSRTLVRQTLGELDLWEDRDFLTGTGSLVGTLASFVAQGVRLVLRAPGPLDASVSEQDGETLVQSRAIDVFLKGFEASPVRNSRLVDISYRSTVPRLATAIIDAHADAYINQNLELRFVTSRDATDWLGEQLANQRRVVEESEIALHRYRQESNVVSFEDSGNIVVQRLAELSAALTRAKTALIAKESVYRQLEAIAGNPDAVDAFPVVVSNRFIQEVRAQVADLWRQRAELSENLGILHPDMVKVQSVTALAEARLQDEIDKVVESVREEFLTAQTQVERLARELDIQKNNALEMDETGIAYGVLARDAQSNRQIYESLLQRTKETGVSAQLRSSNIRVIDRAEVPGSPVSPQKGFILLIVLLTGGFSGVGSALFFEYLDTRIKTPEEFKAYLGLTSLGMVPKIPLRRRTAGVAPLINREVPAEFAEAFRTVRTGVLFSTAGARRSFIVTSTGPGEGKSLVTANLGIGLAQTQQSVLLIDADMRRPSLHTTFGCDLEPGLSELLVGDAKSEDVLGKTSTHNLWLLPAGKIPPNPAELLSSEIFRLFMESLPKHFDWVLIDTPPVMPVTDASILANGVSGIIFVVGADMTDRDAAREALDKLEAADTLFVGGILNHVDLEGSPYYYSRYYKDGYQQCYANEAKSAASTRARAVKL